AQRAEQMRETMATMTDVVRHVASNLRPAALDMGLVAAIEWLAEDFSLRWETTCTVLLSSDEPDDWARLPEPVALALFRAVQESLTNIAKHAQAHNVGIRLQQAGAGVQLSVSDDGRGFDLAAVTVRKGGGLGLLGMRERMHAIGADLDIQTGSGGTTLTIHYPSIRSIRV
ncbi:MAG TPA: ATP-binding protein, partial [Aquabacterium sp.]|nr:ATP-binding protein [Aquabacterium sp.]